MYVVRRANARFESSVLIYTCGGGIELLRCIHRAKDHNVLAIHTFISINLVECILIECMLIECILKECNEQRV